MSWFLPLTPNPLGWSNNIYFKNFKFQSLVNILSQDFCGIYYAISICKFIFFSYRKVFLKYIFNCLFSSIIHVVVLRSFYFVNIECLLLLWVGIQYYIYKVLSEHFGLCLHFNLYLFHISDRYVPYCIFLPLPCFRFCIHFHHGFIFSFSFTSFLSSVSLRFSSFSHLTPHFSECCFFISCLLSENCSVTFFKNLTQGFPDGAVVKNLPANAGNTGLSPGPGRSHMPWSN